MKTSHWILPGHLNPYIISLPEDLTCPVLMIESLPEMTARFPHWQQQALIISAMRHFAEELRQKGLNVDYRQADSFLEGLKMHIEAFQPEAILLMEPEEAGLVQTLRATEPEIGLPFQIEPNNLWLCSRKWFQSWGSRRKRFRRYDFYCALRRYLWVLMGPDGRPIGGRWLYKYKAESTSSDASPPSLPSFPPDAMTRSVIEEFFIVRTPNAGGGGSESITASDPPSPNFWRGGRATFTYPVTRSDAYTYLSEWLNHLPAPGISATRRSEDSFTEVLNTLMEAGIFHPIEIIRAIEGRYYRKEIPIEMAEPLIRPIFEREFRRWMARREAL